MENGGNGDHSPRRAIQQVRSRPECRLFATPAVEVVIDTNVALDWLVFADARVQPLREAVRAGRLRWLATAAMRDELEHMLRHRDLARWAADADAALAQFDQLALPVAAPPAGAVQGLRCRDADDQGFIDLALSRRAAWLFTRDRALLALARRARAHGVGIVTPAAWPGAAAP